MRIGVCEGGFVRALSNPKMPELAHTGCQSSTDLSETLGLSELTEQHRHKLIPGFEPLGIPLGTMLHDQFMKLPTREDRNQLTEKTRTTYHRNCLLGEGLFAQNPMYSPGGFFFNQPSGKPFLDKSGLSNNLVKRVTVAARNY